MGTEPVPPAVKCGVLTTGLLGRSLHRNRLVSPSELLRIVFQIYLQFHSLQPPPCFKPLILSCLDHS